MTSVLDRPAVTRRVALKVAPRALAVSLIMLVLLLILSAVSLSTGDFHIPVLTVVKTLLGQGNASDTFIVETLRLPRLVTAILVGAGFAVGGAMFQSLSRNPLGSPDVVGFNTGAATGALVVLLVWHGSQAQVSIGAVVVGVLTAVLVYVLAMKRGVHGYRLILIGIGVAAMLSSLNSYLLIKANIVEAQAAAVWLAGSLNGRGWSDAQPILLTLIVLLPVCLWLGRGLRMLELGDDLAIALGVRAELTRWLTVLVAVGLTAMATAAAGPIAFVGLSAPQIAKRLTGLPGPSIAASAWTGATLLVAADLVAQRLFAPTQLPVGTVTGVIGGGYLAWLLTTEWRKGRG